MINTLILSRPFFKLVAIGIALISSGYSFATDTTKEVMPYGLWVWSDKGPESTFNVSIELVNGSFVAKVGEQDSVVSVENSQLSISLSNGNYFTGELTEDDAIVGEWYQPAGKYFYSNMVTKVEYPKKANNEWQGITKLQPRPFHIYLDIFIDEQQRPTAVVRNPERNDTFRSSIFDIKALSDNQWQLQAGRGERKIIVPIVADDDNNLMIEHPLIENTITLVKASDLQAEHYYPYAHKSLPVSLTPVADISDDWPIQNLDEAGFDSKLITELKQKIAKRDPRHQSPIMLHSMLISHRGKLIVEEYFHGHHMDTVHDTRSMAKVFGSLLIGAIQQNGYKVESNYSPIASLFKERGKSLPDPRLETITLKHFLTYTSGLDAIESENSAGSEGNLWSQPDDFWYYTANLNILKQPGQWYSYSSASANMVGAAIEQITNRRIHDLFDEYIAKPMNFDRYHWNLTPNGTHYLGGGVYMRPRDMLKVASMYANGGNWQGTQIIPAQWVSESTRPQIAINPDTTGLSEQVFNNNYFGGEQAYIWRVDNIVVDDTTYQSYEATGNGGQMIVVVPELDLAAAFTGGNYFMGYVWGRWRQMILGDYIIRSMKQNG